VEEAAGTDEDFEGAVDRIEAELNDVMEKIRQVVRDTRKRDRILGPPELPSPWSFHFAPTERERLLRALRIGRYDGTLANQIIDWLEFYVTPWRIYAAHERKFAALRARMIVALRRVHRQRQGRQYAGLPRYKRPLPDRDFVPIVLVCLNICGVHIARNEQGWLEGFIKDLCAIVGVRHPNISDALKAAARAQDGPRQRRVRRQSIENI
jgi:hypothetical protein